MPRILHALNDVSGRGNGLINTAVDIAIEQAQRGSTVVVCSGGGEFVPLLESKGVTHYLLNQRRRPLTLLRAWIRLIRIVREFKPDIVHCHMMTSIILVRAVRVFAPFRLISHLHNIHQRSSQLMGLADHVIAVSHRVATYMTAHGIPQEKISTVVSGYLGSARHRRADEYDPMNLHQPAIVTVAGMNKRKGIANLISAFEIVGQQHVDAHLYLVGDGPDRETFEEMARASVVAPRIHFEGFASNPFQYMLAADIFVLASLRESLGLVLVEARECGCAIVASGVDGIPEALDDGKRGILVPPGDVAALAQALMLLLTDRAKHSQLKRLAGDNLSKFSVSRMVDEVMAVYNS